MDLSGGEGAREIMIDVFGWIIALYLLYCLSADMRAMRRRTDWYYDAMQARATDPTAGPVAGPLPTASFSTREGDEAARATTIKFPGMTAQPNFDDRVTIPDFPSPGRPSA